MAEDRSRDFACLLCDWLTAYLNTGSSAESNAVNGYHIESTRAGRSHIPNIMKYKGSQHHNSLAQKTKKEQFNASGWSAEAPQNTKRSQL
jgi:hypothetical protein